MQPVGELGSRASTHSDIWSISQEPVIQTFGHSARNLSFRLRSICQEPVIQNLVNQPGTCHSDIWSISQEPVIQTFGQSARNLSFRLWSISQEPVIQTFGQSARNLSSCYSFLISYNFCEAREEPR
jgi:hypothetical protein